MKMEQTECSETSAYKIQTPGITQKKNTTVPVFIYLLYILHVKKIKPHVLKTYCYFSVHFKDIPQNRNLRSP